MKSFRGTFYLFYYPDDWELKIIENIPSLFHPQGSGALIVVAFRYHDPEGVDTKRELLRYLKAQNIYGAEHRIVNYELSNSIQASTIEYMHKDRFWFANIIGKDHKYILFLWNSDEIPSSKIALDISKIIKSVIYLD